MKTLLLLAVCFAATANAQRIERATETTLDPNAANDARFHGCYRCRKTANRVRFHATKTFVYLDRRHDPPARVTRYMTPLCVNCWAGLLPHDRVRYYRMQWVRDQAALIRDRVPNDVYPRVPWSMIEQVVLKEKVKR